MGFEIFTIVVAMCSGILGMMSVAYGTAGREYTTYMFVAVFLGGILWGVTYNNIQQIKKEAKESVTPGLPHIFEDQRTSP